MSAYCEHNKTHCAFVIFSIVMTRDVTAGPLSLSTSRNVIACSSADARSIYSSLCMGDTG